MPQNIYDNPTFFEGYRKIREKSINFNECIEKPAMRSLLPDLDGLRVLDLGCGFGDFCRYAREQGAKSVVGVDISSNMLDEARKRTDDPNIKYINSAIETFDHDTESIDLIVSSLTFQYIDNDGYSVVVSKAYRWLVAGGKFVFSIEHPYCTALDRGWHKDEAGNKLHWKVDYYRDECPHAAFWFVEGVIIHHRMLETYVNTLLDTGFSITRLIEPDIAPEYDSNRHDFIEEHRRPPFLFLSVQKPIINIQDSG